jgi:hypothetical protein
VRWGSSAGKCIVFLFANWGFSDCFCGKVDARNFKERVRGKVSKVVLRTCMASAFPEKQLLLILRQIKKQYSCWLFDFVCRKNGFYPRQINYTSKPFFLLTKSMQRLPISIPSC